MAHVCDTLTKVDDLENLYGMTLRDAADPDDRVQAARGISLASGAAAAWSLEERKRREDNLVQLQQRLGRVRAMKWALKDHSRFRDLLSRLKSLNDALREILPPRVRRTYDRTLLIDQVDQRDVLGLLASNDVASQRLAGGGYSTAARFKYLVLHDPVERDPTSAPAAVELDLQKLDAEVGAGQHADRLVARYDGAHVLVELKTIEERDPCKVAVIEARLRSLVALLQVTPKPANYRVLDCIGYLRTQTRRDARPSQNLQYGCVFALPGGLAPGTDEGSGGVRIDTLHSLLRTREDNRVPVRYALGARFRLAALLACSLAELHAAKWLHHNITSHNVVCASAGPEATLDRPYVSGFGLARVDDPQEVSEVTSRGCDNNYHHPDYQLPLPPGCVRKYRRSYELYGLGIVLIEIALWKRIEAFRPKNSHARAFARHLADAVVPMVGYYMGSGYADPVACCLDTGRLGVGDDEERRLSEAFSRKVVAALDECSADWGIDPLLSVEAVRQVVIQSTRFSHLKP